MLTQLFRAKFSACTRATLVAIAFGASSHVLSGATASGTALVRHRPLINGTVDGSVQQMSPESVTLNGGAVVTGDLLVPGFPSIRLNGKPSYAGTLDGEGADSPTTHQITLNGGASLRHVVRRVDAEALPAVAPAAAPLGMRSVTATVPAQAVGPWSTLRNLTLNGGVGDYVVPPGAYGDFVLNGGTGITLGLAGSTQPATYHFQSLTLNGQARISLLGPVVITVAHGFAANGQIGAADQPGWLTLNVYSGGFTLNGGCSVHGFVNATNGTVIINGNSQLVGGVACDRLIVNGGGHALIVNKSPVVTLVAPAAGSLLASDAPLSLRAEARDTDGSIASVEFKRGGASLGFASAVDGNADVFELRLASGLPTGLHTLEAVATDDAGAISKSIPVSIRVLAGLPYFTGFESEEGYVPGPLDGQLGWGASGDVDVIGRDSRSGRSSLAVGGQSGIAEALQLMAPSVPGDVLFVEYFARPAVAADPASAISFDGQAAVLAAVQKSADQGQLWYWNAAGSSGGSWTPTAFTFSLGADGRAASWLRLTLRKDYSKRTWDLYADGRMLEGSISFRDPSVVGLDRLLFPGPISGFSGLDDLLVGFENPLFADADRDGMSDEYEQTSGLTPTHDDRDGDLDGDGLTNLREFILGTRADRADTNGDGVSDGWAVRYGYDPLAVLSPAILQSVTDCGLTVLQAATFGIDPGGPPIDANGLSYAWQAGNFGHINVDPGADDDGDGVTHLGEYLQGSDPNDYYNGELPEVTPLLDGSGVLGADGALAVRVTRADGSPLVNAPVSFVAVVGGHKLARLATDVGMDELDVRTDSEGIATVYVQAGGN